MQTTTAKENAIAHYDHEWEHKQWLVKKIQIQMPFMDVKENANVKHESKHGCES